MFAKPLQVDRLNAIDVHTHVETEVKENAAYRAAFSASLGLALTAATWPMITARGTSAA